MNRGAGRTALTASVGTLAAKVIAFVRNVVLAAAIGTSLVSDSYNLANQVPNQLFLLMGGGIIAAVFLPQLAKHLAVSQQLADRYGTLLFILSGAVGAVITVILLLGAPILFSILGGSEWSDAQRSLTLAFAYWCIPQIALAAIISVASQLMYSRNRFALVAWLPALSSLTVIVACMPIIFAGKISANDPGSVPNWVTMALGAATLLGAIIQAILLFVALWRSGFRLRRIGSLRGLGLRIAAKTGVLAIAAAAVFQISNLLTATWTAQAGAAASAVGRDGFGYTALYYAQTILYVVQGVAVASLASILLQRLSKHYANGNDREAGEELDETILRLTSFVVPMTAVFIASGPAIAEVAFARGETSPEAARAIGAILALLATGLLPFTLHTLLIRPFYARHDGMRPLWSAIVIGIVWTGGSALSAWLLPPESVVFGVSIAFALSYWVDLPLKYLWLRRRIGHQRSASMRHALRPVYVGAAIACVVVGVPGWWVLYTVPLSGWGVFAMLVAQTLSLLGVYVLVTRRSEASLASLMRWLRK